MEKFKALVLVTHYRGCGGKKCKTRNKKWLLEALSTQGLDVVDLEEKPTYLGHLHEDRWVATIQGEWKWSFWDKHIFKHDSHYVEVRRFNHA